MSKVIFLIKIIYLSLIVGYSVSQKLLLSKKISNLFLKLYLDKNLNRYRNFKLFFEILKIFFIIIYQLLIIKIKFKKNHKIKQQLLNNKYNYLKFKKFIYLKINLSIN
jgi:hypothetical protein